MVSGRAVILIQRAQVLRYRIAEARVVHELARLEQGRLRWAQKIDEDPRP